MAKDRGDLTQFWVRIPQGMTAEQFRAAVREVSAKDCKSQQDFLRDVIEQAVKKGRSK